MLIWKNYTPTQRKIFQFNFNFNFIYKLGRAKDGFNNNEKINPQMKRRYFEKNIIKMDQGFKILALGEGGLNSGSGLI